MGQESKYFLCKPIAPLTITMGQRLVNTIACKLESIFSLIVSSFREATGFSHVIFGSLLFRP